MQRGLPNIRAGISGLPDDLTGMPLNWLADTRLYFADLPNVVDRRWQLSLRLPKLLPSGPRP